MVDEHGAPPDSFPRDEGRFVFGSVAEGYTGARPDDPDRVYDILRDRCGLAPSSRVVEIGAGTGQATRRLIDAGASVVAVEPAQALAEQLVARVTPNDRLEVIVGAFEDVDLPPFAFDLATAATAFHWLDPERALPKIASILRPGGWLALWWNVFGDPELPDPFHDATRTLLQNVAPGPSAGTGGTPFALDVSARLAELTDHGFRDAEHEAIRWTLRLDAEQARRLYGTYSNIARLPIAQKRAILDGIEQIANDEFSGRIERRMVTPIYTAHR